MARADVSPLVFSMPDDRSTDPVLLLIQFDPRAAHALWDLFDAAKEDAGSSSFDPHVALLDTHPTSQARQDVRLILHPNLPFLQFQDLIQSASIGRRPCRTSKSYYPERWIRGERPVGSSRLKRHDWRCRSRLRTRELSRLRSRQQVPLHKWIPMSVEV